MFRLFPSLLGNSTRRICARLGLVMLLNSTVRAQFESPPPALPPRIFVQPAKDDEFKRSGSEVPGGNSATLTGQFEELTAAIETLRINDPQRAERLVRSLSQTLLRHRMQATQTSQAAKRVGTQSHLLNPRFDSAADLIAQLRATGDLQQANQLQARLARLRGELTSGQLQYLKNDQPELHEVSLTRGVPLPKTLQTAENRYRMGYAEIHLTHTARPIILSLKARDPILWKVVKKPGVRVFAVLVDSTSDQEIRGIDEALILDSQNLRQNAVDDDTAGSHIYASSFAQRISGSSPVTRFSQETSPGSPIIIGADNSNWLTSYVRHHVEQLIAECDRSLDLSQAKKLRDLRFTATYRNLLSDELAETQQGQFTLAGPIDATLKPLSSRQQRYAITVDNGGRSVEFALTDSGQFVTVENDVHGDPGHVIPVPLPAGLLRSPARFIAITNDTKRGRLVLASKSMTNSKLFTFDIEHAEWSALSSLDGPLVGLTYVASDDAYWAILSSYGADDDIETGEFVSIAPSGGVVYRRRISGSLGDQVARHPGQQFPPVLQDSFADLVEVDGYAVLVGTRIPRYGNATVTRPPELLVIEPKTGDVVYCNTIRVNSGGDPVSTLANRIPEPLTVGVRGGVLAQITRKLAAADDAVSRLPAGGNAKRAELESQLESVRNVLYGKLPHHRPGRLYLIGRYSSDHPVELHVTDTSGPVVLALSGHGGMEWKVKAAPGVQLTRIIASGTVQQHVTAKPEGTTVEHIVGPRGFVISDARNATGLARVQTKLRALTGLQLSAHSLANSRPSALVIGPQNGSIRTQLLLTELDKIRTLANQDRYEKIKSELLDMRFHAIHHGPLPRISSTPSRDSRHLSEFSIRGPIIGRQSPLTHQTQFACADDRRGLLYSVSDFELTIWDRETKVEEHVQLRKLAPGFGQTSGLALSPDGKRLFFATERGIYRCDLELRRLERISAPSVHRELGLAHSSSKDVLYSAQVDRSGSGEVRRIGRYNTQGARLACIELSQPFARRRTYGSSSGGFQLVELDRFLVILDYEVERPSTRFNGGTGRPSSAGRIMAVDIETGEVVYQANVKPMIEPRELSQTELALAWDQLGSKAAGDVDALLWTLASGGRATVDFLASQYRMSPESLDPLEVALLVKDLDNHRFSVRDKAFRRLQAAGSAIETSLKSVMNTADTTSEVRERLRSLIANWDAAEPQTDDERRLVRGLELLNRISDDKARALLSALQIEGTSSLIRHHAKRLISQ